MTEGRCQSPPEPGSRRVGGALVAGLVWPLRSGAAPWSPKDTWKPRERRFGGVGGASVLRAGLWRFAGPMVGRVSEGGALGPEACPNCLGGPVVGVALLCSPGRSHINGQVTLGFPKTTKREGISRVRASPELSTPRFCVRATPTTSTAGRRQEESQTRSRRLGHSQLRCPCILKH